MGKEEIIKDPSKVGVGRMLAWQSRAVSTSIQIIMLGYLQIYCTNALGLSAALVGTLLMACKLGDGVTDLVAGYIVDKTNTKWGRGRPYEWCILGLWLTTWLVFTLPESASLTIKCIWIVVCYTLAQSVFNTFLGANQTVYMVRAFNNEKAYVKLSSIGGVLVTLCVIVFNVIFPVFEAKILYDAAGWSKMVACIAVPLTIIGMMRFFFIKEDKYVETKETKGVRCKDILALLKTNKYVYIVALLTFVSTIVSNMSVSQYYFLYIVRNLEISGTMSLFAIVIMPSMLLYPLILKKISVVRMIQLFMLFYAISAPLNWIAGGNLVLIAIAGLLAGMASLPMSFMSGLLIVDCANYNEWKHLPRMEGTLGSIIGFANKIGAAFGTFVVGVMLSSSGFDGKLEVQPQSATTMIRFLFSFMPLIFAAMMFAILFLWNLDKVKPQMLKEIEERRNQYIEDSTNKE